MANKSQIKKIGALFILLLLPSLLYIFLISGKHNFVHLPYVTYMDESGQEQERAIPDFKFVNQNGDTITQDDYRGKIYVADFFFTTCPSICPVMTTNMKEVYGKFGERADFAIISHTVNPEKDSVPVLKKYAVERGVDHPNWNFVTGNKDDIYDIGFNSYLVNAMEDESAPGGFLHSEYFVLVDKEGHIRAREDDNGNVIGVYDGTSYAEVKKLMEDIKVLVAEYQLEKKDKKKSDE